MENNRALHRPHVFSEAVTTRILPGAVRATAPVVPVNVGLGRSSRVFSHRCACPWNAVGPCPSRATRYSWSQEPPGRPPAGPAISLATPLPFLKLAWPELPESARVSAHVQIKSALGHRRDGGGWTGHCAWRQSSAEGVPGTAKSWLWRPRDKPQSRGRSRDAPGGNMRKGISSKCAVCATDVDGGKPLK